MRQNRTISNNDLIWYRRFGSFSSIAIIIPLSIILFFFIQSTIGSSSALSTLLLAGFFGGILLDFTLTFFGFSAGEKMTWFLITILIFSIVGFSSFYFRFEGAYNDVLASAFLFGIIAFILSGMTLSMVVLFAPGYNILRTFRPTDDVGNLTDGMVCFEVPDYLRTYNPKKIEKRIRSIITGRAGYKSWQQTPMWRSVGKDGVKASSLIGFNAYLWFDNWKGGILIAPRSGLLTRFDLATEIKEDVLIDLRSMYGILEDEHSPAYDKLKKAYGQVAASTLERVTAKGTVKTFVQKRGKWVLFTVVTAIIVTAIIIMPDGSVSFFVNPGLGIIAEVSITLYLWYLDRGKGKKKEGPQSQGID